MPLCKLQLSIAPSSADAELLLAELSEIIAQTIGKPLRYVMVTIEKGVSISMSGTQGPAAFAEIRSIGGLSPQVNKTLSARLAALLKERCGIDPQRFYCNFTEIEAQNWGWNGSTFG